MNDCSCGVSRFDPLDSPHGLPLDTQSVRNIRSGIFEKSRTVYASSIQKIGGYERYDGLFCFAKDRYVVALLRRNEINRAIRDDIIARVLSEEKTTDEKVGMLNRFTPTYIHIVKYRDGIKIDDSKGFKSLKD